MRKGPLPTGDSVKRSQEFKGVSAELIQSNLTSKQEAQLLAGFGGRTSRGPQYPRSRSSSPRAWSL